VFEKLPEAGRAILLHDPERKPLPSLLERPTDGLGLRFTGETSDFGDQALDFVVLDVEWHGGTGIPVPEDVNHD
jgi:hypothetical protein